MLLAFHRNTVWVLSVGIANGVAVVVEVVIVNLVMLGALSVVVGLSIGDVFQSEVDVLASVVADMARLVIVSEVAGVAESCPSEELLVEAVVLVLATSVLLIFSLDAADEPVASATLVVEAWLPDPAMLSDGAACLPKSAISRQSSLLELSSIPA